MYIDFQSGDIDIPFNKTAADFAFLCQHFVARDYLYHLLLYKTMSNFILNLFIFYYFLI